MKYRNVYLILGASSDIGTALVEALNDDKENCLFICHYLRHREKLEAIIEKNGNEIKTYQADFSNSEAVQNFIEKIKRCEVPTRIVHLPAGQFEYTRFKKFKWEQFQRELEIQVHSFINILQAFLPAMVSSENKSKIVIMLTSCVVSNPPRFMMNYLMTKYTLLGLMKSMAADYAGKNVCINAVSPSMIETKFLDGIDSRLIEQNAQRSINGRNAVVSDIVPAILFLLSPDSDYIHGINLNISNGNTL